MTFARVLLGAVLCLTVACAMAEALWVNVNASPSVCELGKMRFTSEGGVQICAPR